MSQKQKTRFWDTKSKIFIVTSQDEVIWDIIFPMKKTSVNV